MQHNLPPDGATPIKCSCQKQNKPDSDQDFRFNCEFRGNTGDKGIYLMTSQGCDRQNQIVEFDPGQLISFFQ